jgi:AcrR family transcriptional regulator
VEGPTTPALEIEKKRLETERTFGNYLFMARNASRRDEIIDHATRRATELGLEGLSIGQLAKDLELSKSGLLSHFSTKERLQLDVLDHMAQRFEDIVVRPALRQGRGEPRLRAFFEGWLAWQVRNPFGSSCLFAAASSELDDRDGPLRDKLAAHQQDLAELIMNIVRSGMKDGHFRADTEPELVAFQLKGLILALHHSRGILRNEGALTQAQRLFERSLESILTSH